MIFTGTLRRNLDPFEEHSDVSLWSALEDVSNHFAVSIAIKSFKVFETSDQNFKVVS